MKKKALVFIVALIMCASLVLVLAACGDNPKPKNDGSGGGAKIETMSTKDLLGFSAASTATMLDSIGSTPATGATDRQTTASASAPATNDPTADEISKIHEQIAIIENFIGTNPVTVIDGVSDKVEYKTMLTITTKDMLGETTIYTMYFNETLIVETDDDDDDFELETEQEFSIQGILLVNDITYTLTGEKELDGDEYEISLKAKLDNQNYVTFKQEIEKDEQEFSYTVVKDGAVVSKFSIEIENEKGEQSIEMKNLDIANGINVKFSKEIENGKTLIKATIIENGTKTSMKVFIETNGTGEPVYRFKFSSGKSETYNRGHHFGQAK